MQIVNKNLKDGDVVVKVDNNEDLWYLHQLIAPGDLVSGKSERKIKMSSGDERAAVVKKTVFIALSVERIEFHKHSDSLRLMGIVTDGPEDVPKGSHHTLEVEPGTILTITKDSWASYQLDKLKEASENIRSKILIVVFDREEAIFALLKDQGHQILSKIKGDVSKKRFESGAKSSFYTEIVKGIQEYDTRFSPHNIIVASPSFWKEYLLKEVPEYMKKKLTLATCSEVAEGAISEVMRRPEVFKVLESDRAVKELGLMEELLHAISKEEACYGIKDTEEQVNNGSVKMLLVAYEFLNKARDAGKGKAVEVLLKMCEQRGAKVHVLSTESAEKKLLGLGGIGGVLRWKTK